MQAVITKTTTLTVLSFAPSRPSPCLTTSPHTSLHTWLQLARPAPSMAATSHVWQPRMPRGHCAPEMSPG